jgi:hypothetical protein
MLVAPVFIGLLALNSWLFLICRKAMDREMRHGCARGIISSFGVHDRGSQDLATLEWQASARRLARDVWFSGDAAVGGILCGSHSSESQMIIVRRVAADRANQALELVTQVSAES